jgi:hypothetical protein
MKTVPPQLGLASFSCPHCGALAHQTWWDVYADRFPADKEPRAWTLDDVTAIIAKLRKDSDVTPERIAELEQSWKLSAAGEIILDGQSTSYHPTNIGNVFLSECFSCSQLALWLHNRLVHPQSHTAPPANVDMPIDCKVDYDEAAQIAAKSPRGAAALLRLAIQRLTKHLGQKGKDINDDIAQLVKDGLNPQVQKALDVVRVTGNNAVHPGQMDLKDDLATAMTLFNLVNLIVDAMISQPKHIAQAYGSLPEAARKAIEKRDEKK